MTAATSSTPSPVDPHARLRELGLTLPSPPAALATYIPAVVVPLGDGRLQVWVSGQVAMRDGIPLHRGRVPDQVGVEQAVENARACALNVLAQLERSVGLANVERITQLTVYVRSADEFEQQPQVANGASDLLADVLGEGARHTRAAVGVNALPLGVPVEVSATAIARERSRQSTR
jgi:enamine deaminase RidA (YjgF/YER057c/UK114 family)